MSNHQWRFGDNTMSLAVRGVGNTVNLTPAIREAVWSVDKDQPILQVAMMNDLLSASEAQRRFALILFETFGLVALALAAAGIMECSPTPSLNARANWRSFGFGR